MRRARGVLEDDGCGPSHYRPDGQETKAAAAGAPHAGQGQGRQLLEMPSGFLASGGHLGSSQTPAQGEGHRRGVFPPCPEQERKGGGAHGP